MSQKSLLSLFSLALVAVLFCVCGVGLAGEAESVINAKIGMQVQLPVKQVKGVEVSDEKVVAARIGKDNQVVVSALAKGLTTVTVTDNLDRTASFLVTTWGVLPEELQKMLEDIPGVNMARSGDKMVLSGGVLTQRDKARIEQVARVFAPDVHDMTFYDDQLFKNEALRKILNDIGNPMVDAAFMGNNVVLSGTVYSQSDKENAGTAAAAYVGEVGRVSNSIKVVDLPVEIDVVLLQLSPDFQQRLGAQDGMGKFSVLPVSLQLTGKGAITNTPVMAGTAQVEYDYIIRKSLAKSVWRPHISTISGKPGMVHYGGEIGISVSGLNDGSVDYKDFGLKLTVTPVVSPDETITLNVEMEMSRPRDAIDNTTVTFDRFQTSSSTNIKVGQTIVISGIQQVVRTRSKSYFPILGQIPVLDLIFGADNESVEKTDIVLLLTPELPTIEKKYTGPKHSEGARSIYDKVQSTNMDIKGVTSEF
jgi:Flp pilus assembly secretin CpaC